MYMKTLEAKYKRDYFEKLSKVRLYDRFASINDKESAECISRFILSKLKGGARILNMGIGTGRVAIPLAEYAQRTSFPIRIIGIDVSEGMLEVTNSKIRKKGLKNIEVHMISFFDEKIREKLAEKANVTEFDAVFCFGVAGFFGLDWRDAYSKALGLLKRGGIFFINVQTEDYACLDGNFRYLNDNAFRNKRLGFIRLAYAFNDALNALGYAKSFPVQASDISLVLTWLRLNKELEETGQVHHEWKKVLRYQDILDIYLGWCSDLPLRLPKKDIESLGKELRRTTKEFRGKEILFLQGMSIFSFKKLA